MSSAATELDRLFDQATVDFVVRSLVRLGAPTAELDDLAQDVMVIALTKQQAFDAERALFPWLWGIARNRLRDYRDLARHRREVVTDVVEPAPATTDDRLVGKALQEALGKLDPELQVLVVLHDLEAWTLPECASGLSITLDTAKYRLSIARKSLREQLEKRRPS